MGEGGGPREKWNRLLFHILIAKLGHADPSPQMSWRYWSVNCRLSKYSHLSRENHYGITAMKSFSSAADLRNAGLNGVIPQVQQCVLTYHTPWPPHGFVTATIPDDGDTDSTLKHDDAQCGCHERNGDDNYHSRIQAMSEWRKGGRKTGMGESKSVCFKIDGLWDEWSTAQISRSD